MCLGGIYSFLGETRRPKKALKASGPIQESKCLRRGVSCCNKRGRQEGGPFTGEKGVRGVKKKEILGRGAARSRPQEGDAAEEEVLWEHISKSRNRKGKKANLYGTPQKEQI